MRHRDYLQPMGLAVMLLVTGIVGVLVAPLPSEALEPIVTLRVDGGTAVSIVNTTPVPCTPTEVTQGFTQCHAINTSLAVAGLNAPGGTNRSYNVRNAPNATARLRLADKAGSDFISLAGVHFIPALANWGSAAANTNEQHVLTITWGATFDSAVNSANGGLYSWGVRAGGELRAGPTTLGACGALPCNTIGDVVDFPGKGTFSSTLQNVNILNPAGTATNTTPLRLSVASPTSAIVTFDGLTERTLGQVNPSYPKFTCNDGTNSCKPTVTQTMTVTLKGPDSFVLVAGGDGSGANCAEGLSDEQQKKLTLLGKLVKVLQWLEKQQPNNTKLSAFVDKLEAFLATATRNVDPDCPGAAVNDVNFAIQGAQDQIAFITHGGVSAVPEPPHYYAVINAPDLTWDQARAAAKGIRSDCDLATITSEAEQTIINRLLPNPSEFEGTQDYWVGGFQPSYPSEPGGNWQWINDEGTFWNNGSTGMYANWGSGEPNNVGGSENHLTVDNRFEWGWNDLNTDGANGKTKGYITEGTVGVCVPPIIY